MTLQDAKPWSNRCGTSIAEVRFLASLACGAMSKGPADTGPLLQVFLWNWLFPLDEPYQYHNYRNNEEKVYESSKRVGRHETEKPENKKNCGDGVQHGYDLNQVSL